MDAERLSALAERVLGGEIEVYEAIFLETKDNIYFHAKTILLSEEAAWDAVQDSYIAAFRSLEKLTNSGRLMMWLCAIASNISFTRLKKQHTAKAPAGIDSAHEISEATLEALQDMPRTALLLRYCDDMSLSQIASVMRCSESAAQKSLTEAEKALGLEREVAPESTALTPAELKTQMERLELKCQLPPSLTLSIGSVIAQKCGYNSSLRVTSAVKFSTAPRPIERQRSISAQPRARHDARDTRRSEPKAEAKPRLDEAAPDESIKAVTANSKAKKKKAGMPIGAAVILVIAGLVLGVFAVRYIISTYGSGSDTALLGVTVISSDGAGSAPAAHQELTSEAAQAYLSVLTGYTGRLGVCTSSLEGEGLAYAKLIDLDADGRDELYLYYIDKSFSADTAQYSRRDDGTELWCLHEEIWRYDGGELKKCHEQEHFHTGVPSSANTTGRWLIDDEGSAELVSWHSDVDENGYINQYLDIYTLDGEEFSTSYEVSATFVVANQARYMAEGYAIENYYGTDNAQFDSIAYFFEGAVRAGKAREGYSYTDCQALADLSTSDIVPLDDYPEDNPITMLKYFYDARNDGGTQLIYFNGSTLAWEVSDINAMLSTLADICTGNG